MEETPGPGYYDPPKDHIFHETPLIYHKYAIGNAKKLAFGSTLDRDINFVKRDVRCPYVDRSSFETPSLGSYDLLSQAKKAEGILLRQTSQESLNSVEKSNKKHSFDEIRRFSKQNDSISSHNNIQATSNGGIVDNSKNSRSRNEPLISKVQARHLLASQ